MTSRTNILYPLALDEAGIAVYIKDARRGGLFHCLGCAQIMFAKQGGLRTWHYAHKPPQVRACTPDPVLHRTAQELIFRGSATQWPKVANTRLAVCAPIAEIP